MLHREGLIYLSYSKVQIKRNGSPELKLRLEAQWLHFSTFQDPWIKKKHCFNLYELLSKQCRYRAKALVATESFVIAPQRIPHSRIWNS